eukprot:346090-Chlamydomonas_euryale.AAC.5
MEPCRNCLKYDRPSAAACRCLVRSVHVNPARLASHTPHAQALGAISPHSTRSPARLASPHTPRAGSWCDQSSGSGSPGAQGQHGARASPAPGESCRPVWTCLGVDMWAGADRADTEPKAGGRHERLLRQIGLGGPVCGQRGATVPNAPDESHTHGWVCQEMCGNVWLGVPRNDVISTRNARLSFFARGNASTNVSVTVYPWPCRWVALAFVQNSAVVPLAPTLSNWNCKPNGIKVNFRPHRPQTRPLSPKPQTPTCVCHASKPNLHPPTPQNPTSALRAQLPAAQAQSKSKKIGEETKAQIQQAKDAKQKTQQLEGARTVLGGAFAFKRKGGLFGGRASKAKEKAEKAEAKVKEKEKEKEKGGEKGGGAATAAKAGKAAAETPDKSGGDEPSSGKAGAPSAPAPASAGRPNDASTSPSSAQPAAAAARPGVKDGKDAKDRDGGADGKDRDGAAHKREAGPLAITARDVAAAMERDALLCRHPMLFRLLSSMAAASDPHAPPSFA